MTYLKNISYLFQVQPYNQQHILLKVASLDIELSIHIDRWKHDSVCIKLIYVSWKHDSVCIKLIYVSWKHDSVCIKLIYVSWKHDSVCIKLIYVSWKHDSVCIN